MKQQSFNNRRICNCILFWVKGTLAVGTILNLIIIAWQTFPFVDMTWIDSDGKYHVLSWR